MKDVTVTNISAYWLYKIWDRNIIPPNPPNSLPSSGNCMTVAGPSSGIECIFPFIVDGITHIACTTHLNNPEDEPWCSTKVDDNGNHIGEQERRILMHAEIYSSVNFACILMSIFLAGQLGGLQLRMSS